MNSKLHAPRTTMNADVVDGGKYKKNTIDVKDLNDADACIKNDIDGKSDCAQFPIDVFPLELQELILGLRESNGFHTDFTSVSLLYAASIVIGKRFSAFVNSEYKVFPNIYIVLVAPTGFNKSSPLEYALRPIQKIDGESFIEYKNALAKYKEFVSLSKKAKSDYILENGGAPIEPFCKKMCINDATLEAVLYVLDHNKTGIGLYMDELAGWFDNFNRYNKGREEPYWLSFFDNKTISYDRVSKHSILISQTYVCVGGTIQPKELKNMIKGTRTDNGFMQRFLFAFPDTDGYTHKVKEINDSLKGVWSGFINAMYKEREEPTIELKVDLDAFNTIKERFGNKINELFEDDVMRGYYAKADKHILKIAVILEVLKQYFFDGTFISDRISNSTLKNAERVFDYFVCCYEKVANLIDKDADYLDSLDRRKKDFYRELPSEFKTSDAIKIGYEIGLAERTIKKFLNDKKLFVRVEHGKYEKRFKL